MSIRLNAEIITTKDTNLNWIHLNILTLSIYSIFSVPRRLWQVGALVHCAPCILLATGLPFVNFE